MLTDSGETWGCKIDQIVFWGENEIGADFEILQPSSNLFCMHGVFNIYNVSNVKGIHIR